MCLSLEAERRLGMLSVSLCWSCEEICEWDVSFYQSCGEAGDVDCVFMLKL